MAARLLAVSLVIGLLHTSTAIRCYICQSRSNPACQDPIKSYQLSLTDCTPDVIMSSSRELGKGLGSLGGLGEQVATDLMSTPPGYTHSMMHCQKISFNIGEERVVVRGCQPGNTRGTCRVLEEHATRHSGHAVNYCDSCESDACNGASPTLVLAPLLAPLLVLLALLELLGFLARGR